MLAILKARYEEILTITKERRGGKEYPSLQKPIAGGSQGLLDRRRARLGHADMEKNAQLLSPRAAQPPAIRPPGKRMGGRRLEMRSRSAS